LKCTAGDETFDAERNLQVDVNRKLTKQLGSDAESLSRWEQVNLLHSRTIDKYVCEKLCSVVTLTRQIAEILSKRLKCLGVPDN